MRSPLLRPAAPWALLRRPSPLSSRPLLPPQQLPQPSTQPRSQCRPHSTTTATSSVNETEISHFSSLASSWWDPHGPSRPLHLMNPHRHDFIVSCLSSSPSPSPTTNFTYLDVGCGGGIFAESAARLPTTLSVTGIDASPVILAVARQHAKRDPSLTQKLAYINSPVESLVLPPVDIVTCFEVIEHVDYPSQFLSELVKFVKPGGWVIMSTIARTWTSWVTTNLVAEDILGVVPKGTHDWNKYLHEYELRDWFKKDREEGDGRPKWGEARVMGVVFVPGCGWKEVRGSEKIGNYFFGVQRLA
ncbi:putative methyltransferase [Triangularia setosa]|uniref:Ubiquinone biosynthesis O-methyltransferase, mitochondrial n=1 Tax=Triangularia setosa TaxID=2587417 RepID=A0AAN6WGP2_9PEZI|nr:putative methyltransferase [Podospora setosa]